MIYFVCYSANFYRRMNAAALLFVALVWAMPTFSWAGSATGLFSIESTFSTSENLNFKRSSAAPREIHFKRRAIDGLVVGDSVQVSLFDASIINGAVVSKEKGSTIQSQNKIAILLNDDRNAYYEMVSSNGVVSEVAYFQTQSNKVYQASIGFDGKGVFSEVDANAYYCAGMPTHKETIRTSVHKNLAGAEQSLDLDRSLELQSKPEATNTLFIDFWGGAITETLWNIQFTGDFFSDIDYLAFNLDDDPNAFSVEELYRIRLAWLEVAEDYAAFDINITTSRAIYEATPLTNRSRMIVSATNLYGSGGIATVGSFGSSSGFSSTGWVSNFGVGSLGLTIAHEAGHQMGLTHDGTSSVEYYSGHGNWGPIMGAPFDTAYTHWSKGEYPDANQFQDDIAIIAMKIGLSIDRVSDDAHAPVLLENLPVIQREGIIEAGGSEVDVDHFSFTISKAIQNVEITVIPLLGYEGEGRASNLSIKVSLINQMTNDTVHEISASDVSPLSPLSNAFKFSGDLMAGTYLLSVVAQTPNPNWQTDGFGAYGNSGRYVISIVSDDGFNDGSDGDFCFPVNASNGKVALICL